MSSVDHPALTPQRKRAVSTGVAASLDLPVTPGQPPDLAWDDTPQPQDSAPSTPSPLHGPASYKLPLNADTANIGTFGQCRSPSHYRTREASQTGDHTPTKSHRCEIGCRIHTPSHLFQPLPVPITTGQKCELDPNQINCYFSRQRSSSQRSASKFSLGYASGEPLAPIFPKPFKTHQESLRKKANEEASTFPFEVEHEAQTAPTPTSKTTTNEEAAYTRFSRILPFETIDRLFEDSEKCVASVAYKSGQRCSRVVKSSVNAKELVLNRLSTVEVPLDFGDAKSYIRELTKLATCGRSHRPSATEQLERLIDFYDDRSCTVSEHNFSETDIDFMPVWLKALTTASTKSAHRSTYLNLNANISIEDAKSPTTSELRVNSGSISIEVFQNAESTHSTVMSQSSVVKVDAETAHTTTEVTQTSESSATTDATQTGEISQFSGAKRSITEMIRTNTSTDADDLSQATKTIQSRKIDQALEVTQTTVESQTIKTSQVVEAAQTKICITQDPDTIQSTDVIEKTEYTEIIESAQPVEDGDNAVTSSQPIESSAACSTSIKHTESTKITLTTKVSQTTESFETSEEVESTRKIEIVRTTDQIERTKGAQPIESTQSTKSSVGSASIESTQAINDTQTTGDVRTSPRIRTMKENQKIRTELTFDADKHTVEYSFFDKPVRSETFLNAVKQRLEEKAQGQSPWHNGYQRYLPKASKNVSVQQWLQVSLRRALTPREINTEGLIYMYWHPGKFGFVKIGMTSKTTDERLRQWERQCGGEVEQHIDWEAKTAIRLPHIFRVEALVFAELKNVRVKQIRCEGCGKGHQEWFNVSPEHARKVIEKWTAWMNTIGRYKPVGGHWQLDDMITSDEIQKLCRPIEENTAARPVALRRASDKTRARRSRHNIV